MDIVAVDATNPWGNGFLIPRGILREGLSSLSRADCFVITKSDIGRANVADIKERLKGINAGAPIVETVHKPGCFKRLSDGKRVDLTFIKDKPVCSFCSIGDPQSFEKTLLSLGARLKKNFPFMDHHWYEHKDIRKIVDYCREQDIQCVVTTAKDAVKLREYADLFGRDIPCLILEIKIHITNGRDEFFGRISHLLHG